jgi:hypothetical protein
LVQTPELAEEVLLVSNHSGGLDEAKKKMVQDRLLRQHLLDQEQY